MTGRKEVLVGAVILAGLAVAIVGSLWLSGSGFGREDIPMDILVRDIGQLSEGNSVKYRGVRIGRIQEVEVATSGEAVRVGISLNREVPLPEDVVALIAPESLFGEWQVELVSRSGLSRFNYFDVTPAQVAASDVPIIGGYAIPDISRLTATANEISENLAVLSSRVEEAFTEETAEDLRETVANLRDISVTIRDFSEAQSGAVSTVTEDIANAAAEVSAAATTGRAILERMGELMEGDALDSIFVDVGVAADNLARISGDVSASTDDLQSAMMRADSAFARIDRLTARIERGEGLIGQLMSDSTLVGQTGEVLTQLELLLRDLRENPKRYVRLSIF